MFVVVGTIIHSTWEDPVVFMENRAIGATEGKIVFISKAEELAEAQETYRFTDKDVIRLSSGEFLIPGFVDTHIHASQYVNAGIGLDLPLLDWLETYTFPAEAKFSNIKYAKSAYNKVVRRVLSNGTTTACYFATIDVDATLELCRIIADRGQRALVGKVCMNQNSPEYYCETSEESITDTERFIESVKSLDNPLVQPIVTPRFAISCDRNSLQSLGRIATETGVHIQSHVSENRDEVQWVQEVFPECSSYTDVYFRHGLLNSKTVMAHGVYLTQQELKLFKETGASISHCPNSNMSLSSGLCDVRRLLDHGIKVGLGTDVSGGYHPSMLDAIRHATHTSNILSLDKGQEYSKIDYKEAFRLATLGGSQALAMDSCIGNFEVGKQFDALVIQPGITDGPIDIFDDDTINDVFQKFIYLGDDRNISRVYVAGRMVHSAAANGIQCCENS